MIFLRSIEYKRDKKLDGNFPFSIPVINNLSNITLKSDITFLVGENGSGKSTFLEALAASINAITIGEESIEEDKTLLNARLLGYCFKLTWNTKTKKGFFMRAEDFFQYTKRINTLRQEMVDDLQEVNREYKHISKTAQLYARASFEGSANELENRYGKDMDAHSHGEGFIEFFKSRVVPDGLYLLDEPEAPLSPVSQLSLMMLINEMLEKNTQFIIATHSPILLAYPNATILSFDDDNIHEVEYNDLKSVKLLRNFLKNPDLYLSYINK